MSLTATDILTATLGQPGSKVKDDLEIWKLGNPGS
jgi:hypothetical protein